MNEKVSHTTKFVSDARLCPESLQMLWVYEVFSPQSIIHLLQEEINISTQGRISRKLSKQCLL